MITWTCYYIGANDDGSRKIWILRWRYFSRVPPWMFYECLPSFSLMGHRKNLFYHHLTATYKKPPTFEHCKWCYFLFAVLPWYSSCKKGFRARFQISHEYHASLRAVRFYQSFTGPIFHTLCTSFFLSVWYQQNLVPLIWALTLQKPYLENAAALHRHIKNRARDTIHHLMLLIITNLTTIAQEKSIPVKTAKTLNMLWHKLQTRNWMYFTDFAFLSESLFT